MYMNAIAQISHSLSQYRSRVRKSKDFLSYAKTRSVEEIVFNIQKIKSERTRKVLLDSLLTVTRSSVWVSRSAFLVLKSYFDILPIDNENLASERAQDILASVVNKRTVDASDEEVFRTIYFELTHAHLHTNYLTPLIVPKVDVTIVLVSGVLNEIFSTPAFQRGAENLLDHYRIKHFAPTVNGKKGSRENSYHLRSQLMSFIEKNPNEKLWFFCFSKGGVDTLHFLKREGEKLSPNILGCSLVATPILGSEHPNNKVIRAVNAATHVPEVLARKVAGKKVDIFAKELQKSLSKNYRESWFKRYHKELPKRPFYTAVAFESKWHQSHVYMMFTKAFFQSSKSNDGVVDVENAQFPSYFKGINLGVIEGHHLVGSRSSFYDQEALMKAHIIFLNYKKLI